jgi:hypothetical protein
MRKPGREETGSILLFFSLLAGADDLARLTGEATARHPCLPSSHRASRVMA